MDCRRESLDPACRPVSHIQRFEDLSHSALSRGVLLQNESIT